LHAIFEVEVQHAAASAGFVTGPDVAAVRNIRGSWLSFRKANEVGRKVWVDPPMKMSVSGKFQATKLYGLLGSISRRGHHLPDSHNNST
jgi:hypothetical protein